MLTGFLLIKETHCPLPSAGVLDLPTAVAIVDNDGLRRDDDLRQRVQSTSGACCVA